MVSFTSVHVGNHTPTFRYLMLCNVVCQLFSIV